MAIDTSFSFSQQNNALEPYHVPGLCRMSTLQSRPGSSVYASMEAQPPPSRHGTTNGPPSSAARYQQQSGASIGQPYGDIYARAPPRQLQHNNSKSRPSHSRAGVHNASSHTAASYNHNPPNQPSMPGSRPLPPGVISNTYTQVNNMPADMRPNSRLHTAGSRQQHADVYHGHTHAARLADGLTSEQQAMLDRSSSRCGFSSDALTSHPSHHQGEVYFISSKGHITSSVDNVGSATNTVATTYLSPRQAASTAAIITTPAALGSGCFQPDGSAHDPSLALRPPSSATSTALEGSRQVNGCSSLCYTPRQTSRCYSRSESRQSCAPGAMGQPTSGESTGHGYAAIAAATRGARPDTRTGSGQYMDRERPKCSSGGNRPGLMSRNAGRPMPSQLLMQGALTQDPAPPPVNLAAYLSSRPTSRQVQGGSQHKSIGQTSKQPLNSTPRQKVLDGSEPHATTSRAGQIRPGSSTRPGSSSSRRQTSGAIPITASGPLLSEYFRPPSAAAPGACELGLPGIEPPSGYLIPCVKVPSLLRSLDMSSTLGPESPDGHDSGTATDTIIIDQQHGHLGVAADGDQSLVGTLSLPHEGDEQSALVPASSDVFQWSAMHEIDGRPATRSGGNR
eukprot:jgi/Chrzof1/849/Cz01g31090.t1